MTGGSTMFAKDWKKDIFTIPNLLSMFRLILIPVYILIFIKAEEIWDYYIAAGILAVSCLTDLIDGKIARHFNMISNLGKILDPVADKATQFSLIVCLATKYRILWYLLLLFVIKEGFQLIAGGINLLKNRKMLKGAQLSGKICTAVLFVSLILMVMFPYMDELYLFILFSVDIICMIVAFLDYLITYIRRENKFQSISDPPDIK